ncbi:MAG: hypothetical protein K2H99_04855 [Paramuribaculum sp.]|nr:hypothetical protein [Paramuribaculum sp.]
MKNTKKQKKIYRLKDISIDEIIKSYLHYQYTGTFDGIKLEFIPSVHSHDPQPIILNEGDCRKKTITILSEKFVYLIHLIRNRQIANGGGFVPFSSVVLEKIFGKDYSRMIQTLLKMELLACDSYYKIGEKSYGFRFNDTVRFTYTLENQYYLSKYSDKAYKLFQLQTNKDEIQARKALNNDTLYNRYNESLRMLRLTYSTECEQYLSLHTYLNNLSRDYHYYIKDYYLNNTPTITSIDKNNRIYSVATSTPRVIKPFLNIKFSCDIHNSHPLLFNSILFDYYDISLSLRKTISTLISTLNIPSRNVRRNIRKVLIYNGIKRNEIANIPTDVLAYIYITSKGVFWDSILPDDSQLMRTDIKVLMFAEVFYSKKLTTRGQKYAKLFKAQFPKVYKVVRKQKEADRTKLANDMMKLESKLFHEILMKLYNKRYRVVSIHDAIVVLDVKANESCSVEVVKEIICKVYASQGLHPDVSTDYYGKEFVDRILSNEVKANTLIEEYKQKLSEQVKQGDKDAIKISDKIERCEIEVIPNSDYTDIVLHPLKFR